MAAGVHIVGDNGRTLCGAEADDREPAAPAFNRGTAQPWQRRRFTPQTEPCGKCLAINRAAQQAGHTVGGGPWAAAAGAAVPVRHRVVVSMTSVPARNGTLGPTITSLRAQTRPPDEIRLYIGPGCAPIADRGSPPVICVSTTDCGPVTKLGAVADKAVRPDAIIVTVDDDITFHKAWLATLLGYTNDFPDDAIGMAGWNAAPLIEFGIFEMANGPCDVIEGFGGVAYRKWFFGPDVLRPPDSMKWVDDVWISSYLQRAGIPRRVVHERMVDISRSQSSGIHTRPDFLELNKRAAMAAFATHERIALLARKAAARPCVPR